MGAFSDREFKVILMLASPTKVPAWHWNAWPALGKVLSPLLTSPRGRTGVSSFQTDNRTKRGDFVRFGTLTWSDKSHRKWTHGSPDTLGESEHWKFRSVSVSAPGRGICGTQGLSPDGFLVIKYSIKPQEYAYSISLAVAKDIDGIDDCLLTAVDQLKTILQPVLSATTTRPWAFPCGTTAHKDAIWDLFEVHGFPLERPGVPVDPITIDMLRGEWRPL